MIGSFGNIVFETSSSKIRTFNEFKRKGSAVFAEHPVLDGKPRLQHTGEGLDEISFSVRFDISLGVIPKDEVAAVREILKTGDEQKLIIGNEILGDFVLTGVEEAWKKVDGKGRLVVVELVLSIKEFVNGD